MPLSEREQRMLNEIEQALYAEDPKFASSVRSARPRNRARIMLALAVVGVIGGLAVVIVGLAVNIIPICVAGFLIMVGSLVAAVSALRGPRTNEPISLSPRRDTRNSRPTGLREKMEDRMRRRFDQN